MVALLHELLVGTFDLVSVEERGADGEVVHPFGTNPIGTFTFDRDGSFAVQLMDPDRTSGDVARGVGYTGMFGTYEVDEDRQTFRLTPRGASQPSLIGADILRHVRNVDGLAVFTTPTQVTDGVESTTIITWRKVAPPRAAPGGGPGSAPPEPGR